MKYLPQLQLLFKKYGKKKHPLEYANTYQLMVMVVLSAQTTDAAVNKLAPELFNHFPSMKQLATAHPEELFPFIKSVRGFRKKADWLIRIAQCLGDEKKIQLTMKELTELPGIGRKSANVIIREAGGVPQGIIVDLHVLRVVPRLGITAENTPEKMEKALMDTIPEKYWNAAGMSFSYLGRELCRPTKPNCVECVMNSVCEYCKDNKVI
ncbi:MAG: endonuclease III [Ignavibacteriales bacterium]|nr:endonuclease III [Ignavibacteriales bacterium]